MVSSRIVNVKAKVDKMTQTNDLFDCSVQLKERTQNNISSLFSKSHEQKFKESLLAILTSSSDLGVLRNGGRRGSCYGPEAIIYQLKKLTTPHAPRIRNIDMKEVFPDAPSPSLSFEQLQTESSELIHKALEQWNGQQTQGIVHLGGGHDHVLNLLCGLRKSLPSDSIIKVINLDPHLDTRQDSWGHSGTPFRQWANQDPKTIIYQLGTQQLCNTRKNFEQMNNMKVLFLNELLKQTSLHSYLKRVIPVSAHDFFILSIDLDVISYWQMPAVSAPNPFGLSFDQVLEIIQWYQQNVQQKYPVIGFYEFNPLYDHLSGSCAKWIATMIYRTFIE